MIIVRSITIDDFNAFAKLAFTARAGMMNMPKSKEILYQKVEHSVASFASAIAMPRGEFYLFVLEDLKENVIGGSCAIKASTGVKTPYHYFRIGEEHHPYPKLALEHKIPTLTAESYVDGPSEACSLYLLPRYRQGGLGRLLSLSRFLFMAHQPQRFKDTIFASMRGIIDHNGRSPFWEHVGTHFLPIDYKSVLKELEHDEQFAAQVAPHSPIYIPLLNSSARHSLGKVHPDTSPALKILLDEGFKNEGKVDIFDGGPRVLAVVDRIRTVKEHLQATVSKIIAEKNHSTIVASKQQCFRACYSNVVTFDDGTVGIPHCTAEALHINEGDIIYYVSSKRKQ